MKPISSLLVTFFACLLFSSKPCQAEVVTVYTNVNFAPLVISDGVGLYPDMVAYLNSLKLGNLSFKLSYLPRKRLQVKLEEGSLDGIVIGMAPQWFDDVGQTKYLWTAPFSEDKFVLVSNVGKPVSTEHPASLAGTSVGMTLGYVYPGIEPWIAANGLVRSDAPTEEKNIGKLLLERVDCIVVSRTVINYYIKLHGLQGKLHMAPLPGPLALRRILVPHQYRHVYERLAPAIGKLGTDPAWQHIASKY
jgi:polar amino acid transport system substrate-binding protein